VLFVGMLSGTYSSIFIATPVLADLKEREPQYQALAKRVSVRASGGRAAKRSAAKAGSRSATAAAQAPLPEADTGDVEADTDFDDDAAAAPPASALSTTRVPAARGTPGTARPGPRQQPRRAGGSTRGRPAGKKKRR
jgi:preprotein translocase subunit SecF